MNDSEDTLGDASSSGDFFGDLTSNLSDLATAATPVLTSLKVGTTASQPAAPAPTVGSPAAASSSKVILYVVAGIAAIIGLVFFLRK